MVLRFRGKEAPGGLKKGERAVADGKQGKVENKKMIKGCFVAVWKETSQETVKWRLGAGELGESGVAEKEN